MDWPPEGTRAGLLKFTKRKHTLTSQEAWRSGPQMLTCPSCLLCVRNPVSCSPCCIWNGHQRETLKTVQNLLGGKLAARNTVQTSASLIHFNLPHPGQARR